MTAEHGLDLPAVGERQSLREQVSQALRAALITGEMRPGVVYSAPVLAQQFGVSATPVREAMLDLAKEGLVEAVRNKGFRVTELSDRDLDELTEIRRLIEVPTVTRLAGAEPAADFGRLRPVAEEIVSAAERADLLAYVDADLRFHLELLALSGNAHLVSVVKDLRTRARLYGLARLPGRTLTDSAREHLDLLDALERGDPDAVGHIMGQHIQHVRGIWAHPASS
ncbi:GntR family transcriptional regulator [Nonomuraea muscovyensis]|jgi:DNA-binding GntR family transcriptional regulator|uniref:DNA-binding GntR family transcriptional regulator n=1 Tax=Nonomuraea muscovyensis TaxID=1124761 RepID=A0A7X0C5E4_9ACTN|nr:GntR family transcriptional regulator [Nonomuraea muscovyensis]MBB6348443.1 DNA-binding GntR family transcriptional regulator [Nonomuraea muscovyensis]MDF2706172.1 GntR family transcriptional regulator [Nonomuraea muscovyensis]